MRSSLKALILLFLLGTFQTQAQRLDPVKHREPIRILLVGESLGCGRSQLVEKLAPRVQSQLRRRYHRPFEVTYSPESPQDTAHSLMKNSHYDLILYAMVSAEEFRSAAMHRYAPAMLNQPGEANQCTRLEVGGAVLGVAMGFADPLKTLTTPFFLNLSPLTTMAKAMNIPFWVIWLGLPMTGSSAPIKPISLSQRLLFWLLSPLQTRAMLKPAHMHAAFVQNEVFYGVVPSSVRALLAGPAFDEWVENDFSNSTVRDVAVSFSMRLKPIIEQLEEK